MKKIKFIVLLFVLLTVPLASLINQQTHKYQSAAREKKTVKYRTLYGFVYEDKNNNQMKEPEEPGVAAVSIIARTLLNISSANINPEEKEKGKQWNESQIFTDNLGSFQIDLPRSIPPKSSRVRIAVIPPPGYRITTTTKYRYDKTDIPSKGERMVLIGINRDESLPQPSPTFEPTVTPLSTPDPTNAPPPVPTASPTPPVCPPQPMCDGELVTIEQPGSLACPIYICYVIDPDN